MQVGQIIDGKYRVGRLLGQGGMGAVYEGLHTLIDRRVAIKVLSREVSSSKEGIARFAREARAAGRIGNDHILDIYDVGSLPDGTQYLVSEYLEGETLASRLARVGPLAPREICALALQLLSGLAAAHQSGIVHRDLKPDNVFLLRDGRRPSDFVKIIDFGISKFDGADDPSMSMTRTGMVLGTPYYLSPEQARGTLVDARSDLYSVGVILYEAVSSRVPFSASNFNELLFKIVLERPTPLEDLVAALDPAFCELIRKAMDREPAERFQSALEMQEAISFWLSLSTSADGQGVPVRGEAAPFWRDKSPPWAPTGSNFGGTAQHGILARLDRTKRRLAAAGVLAVVFVSVIIALLLHPTNTGQLPGAPGVAAASTSVAPIPIILPSPSPVVPDVPSPPAPESPLRLPVLDHVDPAPSLRTAGDNGRLAHQKRLPISPKATAVRVQPGAVAPANVRPASSAESKLDRDFGY